MIDVCDIQVMKPLLESYGFRFSKAKGQNFLAAGWVPREIAEQTGIDRSTGVVEIGPGIGSLTQQLCLRAGKVCALEVDRRLEPILGNTLGEFDNLTIRWGDAMKEDLAALVRAEFPGMEAVACANLPYYITTPAVAALLESEAFRCITVMVQQEVAQRMTAAPGSREYGAFSLFCQYYSEPEILFTVGPQCFLPQPKVTSAVVKLNVRREIPWDVPDRELFFRVIRASFNMRRKKLSNGLASGFPELGKDGAGEVIDACGLREDVRGETLGIPEFAALSRAIAQRRKG